MIVLPKVIDPGNPLVIVHGNGRQREGCSLFIMLILVATVVARGPTESSARTGRRTGAIFF